MKLTPNNPNTPSLRRDFKSFIPARFFKLKNKLQHYENREGADKTSSVCRGETICVTCYNYRRSDVLHENIDYIYSCLNVVCVHYTVYSMRVCVCQLLAATCESEVERLASLSQRPPWVDALERERTGECSAHKSEATPHGPLGIYYNQ